MKSRKNNEGEEIWNIRIPDDSILVGFTGEPIWRESEYVDRIPIAKKVVPPIKVEGLVIQPEREVLDRREWDMTCGQCGFGGMMKGYRLVKIGNRPNAVAQCPNCLILYFLDVPEERSE